MATSEDVFEALMRRVGDLPEPTWETADDLGRRSIEALLAKHLGDARELRSRGQLRLHGTGVEGHSAPLASVGLIASQWQRAVTAVGASLEGIRSSRGRLSEGLGSRTALMLSASPAPGSVILDLAPKADAFAELAPEGTRPIFNIERPLADRANETLIDLLSRAANAGPDAQDLSAQMRDLGARVASNVKALALTLDDSLFDLDASWAEPGQPTARATISSSVARWLAEFVDGQALDSYEDEIVGVARTVSDVSRWRIETDEGTRFVDVTELAPEDIARPHVGETVRLRVRVQPTQRPDGSSTESYTALELLTFDN